MNSHYMGENYLKRYETSHHQSLDFHIDVTVLLRTDASLWKVIDLRLLRSRPVCLYENVSSENHNFDVKLCMQKCENTAETLPESKL